LTTLLNQDGKVVTVVMNESDVEVKYNLCIGTKATEVVILPHAIQTLVY
jgi:glucosylceramidase